MDSLKKNAVLQSMIELVNERKAELLAVNQIDLNQFNRDDRAMYDRLKIDDHKIAGMVQSIQTVMEKPDPIGIELYKYLHPKGMLIKNKTAPFGTILIIYESRPDVTIEAAVLAFKAGNKILLKGGKEAIHSNQILVQLWHDALAQHGLDSSWITYLKFSREETQTFLKSPPIPLDLIVPRGGEKLINFVKQHSKVPVLVSGRGNNFMYLHAEADWKKVIPIVLNAKTDKISACNALDKLLLDPALPQLEEKCKELLERLSNENVEILIGEKLNQQFPDLQYQSVTGRDIWEEEFLALKILIDLAPSNNEVVLMINNYSGGHSASIITENLSVAEHFMDQIDAAAVYHNASTRFTDGGEFGMGAELAISTDKLHHRGPLGLEQLVSNKWYVYGSGQVR